MCEGVNISVLCFFCEYVLHGPLMKYIFTYINMW